MKIEKIKKCLSDFMSSNKNACYIIIAADGDGKDCSSIVAAEGKGIDLVCALAAAMDKEDFSYLIKKATAIHTLKSIAK